MTPPQARRLLMTTDAVGGVWVYATELARALSHQGFETTLVTMGPAPSQDQLKTLHEIQGLSVEITNLALEWMEPEGCNLACASDTLLKIADRVRPDVVHLNSYREASFDWSAPVLVVAHSCVLSWWQACHGSLPNDPRWERYAEGVVSGLAEATAWVAPSEAFRDTIQAIYQPPTRGRVIWNGIASCQPPSPKEPFVLAAGRLWDEAKGLAALAAIASDIDWPVRVAGPTRAPGKRSGALAVGNIDWLGPLSRSALAKQMQRAGIFTSPALYEPFGLSVLEAAASGCALVLADIPAFRELWSRACLFVDPRDDDSVLSGLQRLCRDSDLREHLQQEAKLRARRYSVAATASAYRAVYEALRASIRPASMSNMIHELHP